MKPDFLTSDEIKKLYLGKDFKREANAVSQMIYKQEALTHTAKDILKTAKEKIGENSAFNEHPKNKFTQEHFESLVQSIEKVSNSELSAKERQSVIESLTVSFTNYDILTPLVNNPCINDIIVSNYKDISVQIGRENIKTDLKFTDHHTYCAFIENLLKRCGKACTLATPVVDTTLDRQVRICVTHESFSPIGYGPMLTLRIARHPDISFKDLIELGLAPKIILNYLAAIIHNGKDSLLIAGEVGTGKTTLTKGLATQISEKESILIIEDTNEIVLSRNFVRTLLTREANTEGYGRITPAQAIHTGMRMAMNRIILGEIRSSTAAEAFIDVCSSGHSGMSTIHARSAKDALSRLELFLSRAQGNVTIESIRRQISNALAVVLFLGLDKTEKKRRILEVAEVGSAADGVVQISPIFSYLSHEQSSAVPTWRRDSGISAFGNLLNEYEVVLPTPGSLIGLD
ncbi:MAG: Flp pilus assembly complex ATPase component TadA [Deltaproteobacteria bacterium]|jgi:pilus assembly protein CpaF|nr:Flp pilus assembly complex ATPase component TadA [Deltaproteobacteria bacterium]